MIAACEGSNYVIHTASPFFMEAPKDVQKDLIIPAVNGTTCVLKGCQKHKVEKCVITASIATMVRNDDPKVDGRVKIGPKSWSLEKNCDPYFTSKLLAEQAAWEFQKNLPEEEKFPIVTIHPGFIMGPTFTRGTFESGKFASEVMMGKSPGGALPPIEFGLCDVRDVAKAHVEACLRDEANN
jgi:nucleoside-diphosphate-sugar epimerase